MTKGNPLTPQPTMTSARRVFRTSAMSARNERPERWTERQASREVDCELSVAQRVLKGWRSFLVAVIGQVRHDPVTGTNIKYVHKIQQLFTALFTAVK